jgi:ABC-type transport system involved in cytochrome c biogenesis ATPase subunit
MIKEIVLRRFKRFQEERFDLTGNVILAGPNNCGKTTVLQAIAVWALALRTWERLNDYQRHGGAYTKAPIARQAFSAVPLRSFDLLWSNRKYGGVMEIEALIASGTLLTGGTRLTMEFQADSTEQIYVRPKNNIIPDDLRAFKYGAGGLIDVVYVATVGGLSVEEPVYQTDYIETLLGRQRPGDVVRNLLLQASKSGTSWIPLSGAVSRLFGVELLVPSTPAGQIVCEYRQSNGGTTFDLASAGSGFQQVIMLLACLFTCKGSVILVDEPDAHLHVFLQDTIFAELGKAAAETGSQLVIATHSEVIFNSAAPEQICIMMGKPRRLSSALDVQKLRQAVAILQQSDLVQALEAPGILYLEGYTDLNLLREWARILGHPLMDYLNRTPFWRGKQSPAREGATEVPASDHFNALRLVNEQITGVWLVDADGRQRIPPSEAPERQKLNRACWKRYETESYLVHPASLARYIDQRGGGGGGVDAVRRFMTQQFNTYLGPTIGAQVANDFIANPLQPPQAVDRYLTETKARTTIVGGIMQEGGIHGMNYTRFSEIAAIMEPGEIHPEVKEKLDFIQQAFGL